MPFHNADDNRLYQRLWSRVRRAVDPAVKHSALVELRGYFAERRKLTPQERVVRRRVSRNRWREVNIDRVRRGERMLRLRLKRRAIRRFSFGTMACAECGSTDFRRLEIDHTNGDWSGDVYPNGHRVTGTGFWRRILREESPGGRLQVLCTRCNKKKGPLPYAYSRGRAEA